MPKHCQDQHCFLHRVIWNMTDRCTAFPLGISWGFCPSEPTLGNSDLEHPRPTGRKQENEPLLSPVLIPQLWRCAQSSLQPYSTYRNCIPGLHWSLMGLSIVSSCLWTAQGPISDLLNRNLSSVALGVFTVRQMVLLCCCGWEALEEAISLVLFLW